jgi:hypothetical protein
VAQLRREIAGRAAMFQVPARLQRFYNRTQNINLAILDSNSLELVTAGCGK